MDNRCIAVYDSGAGGLDIARRLAREYPSENVYFFSDRRNLPYGDKTTEELLVIAQKNISSIMTFCPKMIILACNTLSTSLLSSFSHFTVPVFGVFPFVPTGKKTLLVCTPLTAESDYVLDLKTKNPDLTVFKAEGLAEAVENWIRGGEKPDIKKLFEGTEKDFEAVSLGCTHYLHLKGDFEKLFPASQIVDGSDNLFKQIKGELTTYPHFPQRGCVYLNDEGYNSWILNNI